MNTPFTRGRVRFHAGRATLRPPAPVPAGMVPGRVSILSPGTEQRRLNTTRNGPARDAGYMNIATIPDPERAATGQTGNDRTGVRVVAPVPHGSAFDPRIPGALTAAPGTPLHVLAVARFQLIAARGLDRLLATLPAARPARLPATATDGDSPDELDEVVVMGSGPVALGCVLELRRRGAGHIRVVTRRVDATINTAPGVTCVDPTAATPGPLVIDAAGSPGMAFGLVAKTGVLGLLGTPADGDGLDAAAVHRSGAALVGMHELADASPVAGPTVSPAAGLPLSTLWCANYQDTYTAIVSWLINHVDQTVLSSWCLRIPGERAPEIYARLPRSGRPPTPIVLWEWP